MPQVPSALPTAQAAGLGQRRVGSAGIPVQSAALPAIRVPRDGRGEARAATGRALSGLGEALGGIADERVERERRARDRALLQEAGAASAAAVDDLLDNPERGYLGTAARGALLARDETLRALDAVGRRAQAGLEPALRPAFAGLWESQRRQAGASIDGHARAQFAAWLDSVDLAEIAAAREAAAGSGGAPEAVGTALARGASALEGLAARGGWPAGERRRAADALRSSLHDGVVRRLLEQEDFGRAFAYFRAAGDELSPGDRGALEPLVAGARERAAELARAAAAERLIAGWQAEGLDPGGQRAAAVRLRNPALAAQVVERLDLAAARRARDARTAGRQALDSARQAVEQGALPDELPFATLQRLGPPQRRALARRARRVAGGEQPASDLPLLHRLRRRAADHPEAFAALDLFTEARDRLDDRDYGALERHQAALLREREGAATEADRALLDREAAVQAAAVRRLAAEGHDLVYAPTPQEADAFAAFESALRRRAEAEQRRRGEPADRAGLDALAAETYEDWRDRLSGLGEPEASALEDPAAGLAPDPGAESGPVASLRSALRGVLEAARSEGDGIAAFAERLRAWAEGNPLDAAALALSPLPVAGDLVGLAADGAAIYRDPSWTNVLAAAAGLVPELPGGFALRLLRRLTHRQKAQEAIEQALTFRSSVRPALRRDDLGDITIDYGDERFGLRHIIERRNVEGPDSRGLDGEAFVRTRLADVLAFGKLQRLYGPGRGRRAELRLGNDLVRLSLYRGAQRETWVITAYELYGARKP